MEDTILHSRTTLLSLPEEKLQDKDDLIVPSLLNIIHSFSKINKVRALFRHKPVTEAKAEEIAYELSKILFYTGCLVHLLDVETDIFDEDKIQEFSETLDQNYTQDAILCALFGIRTVIDISESLFYEEALNEFEFEESLGGEPDALNVAQLELGPGEPSVAEGEEEEDVFDHESAIACLYTCVAVLCENLELDLEAVKANVKTITKFQF